MEEVNVKPGDWVRYKRYGHWRGKDQVYSVFPPYVRLHSAGVFRLDEVEPVQNEEDDDAG